MDRHATLAMTGTLPRYARDDGALPRCAPNDGRFVQRFTRNDETGSAWT
ncbi:hypothetical protein [Rhodoferax sp.]|nr:hypothetical protein [Rhodoferax sp.]